MKWGANMRGLLAALNVAPRSRKQLEDLIGVDGITVHKTVWNAKANGYVENGPRSEVGAVQYQITDGGRERLGQLASTGITSSLAAEAVRLIATSPDGLDSGELAVRLDRTTAAEIVEALKPHVASRLLVASARQRHDCDEGVQTFDLYRIGIGDSIAEVYAKLPSCVGPQRAYPDMQVRAAKSTSPAPTAAVNIDAVHRKYDDVIDMGAETVRSIITSEAQPESKVAPAEDASDAEFLCTLYSDGTLWYQVGDQQFDLAPEHARKLAGYLHHVRAAKLLNALLGGAS